MTTWNLNWYFSFYTRQRHFLQMMMIVFITFNSSLVPLIEGLCSSNPWEFEFSDFRRNRTDDLGINSPSLWPTELRLHVRLEIVLAIYQQRKHAWLSTLSRSKREDHIVTMQQREKQFHWMLHTQDWSRWKYSRMGISWKSYLQEYKTSYPHMPKNFVFESDEIWNLRFLSLGVEPGIPW